MKSFVWSREKSDVVVWLDFDILWVTSLNFIIFHLEIYNL